MSKTLCMVSVINIIRLAKITIVSNPALENVKCVEYI